MTMYTTGKNPVQETCSMKTAWVQERTLQKVFKPHQFMQFSVYCKEKHSNRAQPRNTADPTWYRNQSFSSCNVQQIQNLAVFDFAGNSFPSYGICNKHHHSSSSQKSSFSKGACHRHDETCNMLNIIKANSCFYHPTRRFLITIDIFIIVSVQPCSVIL